MQLQQIRLENEPTPFAIVFLFFVVALLQPAVR